MTDHKRMTIVYIGGPYRSDCVNGIRANINVAADAAAKVWSLGAAALCPHTNSAFMDGAAREETFLAGGIEFLRHADAMLLVGAWKLSKGTVAEKAFAEEHSIPVFSKIEDLDAWLKCQDEDPPGAASC